MIKIWFKEENFKIQFRKKGQKGAAETLGTDKQHI